jgi:hypothetical protein
VFALTLLEQGRTRNAADLIADLPPDGGNPNPGHIGQTHLTRAFLADLQGDAAMADSHLKRAEDILASLNAATYTRRMLAFYRTTRSPGAAGGTTLWAAADAPVDP